MNMKMHAQCGHSRPWRFCRFAQVCEIGPRDFFRSLYVDSTTQGDFGHVVRSSVGCLGSEIFWVMCGPFFRRKALFWAQISIFDPKILRFSESPRSPFERAWVQGSIEPKISTNGPLQRPTGRFECFSLFSVIFCFFEYVIFIDTFSKFCESSTLERPIRRQWYV